MLISTILVKKPIAVVWQHWTTPGSIKNWNIPFDDWHCPKVENDVKVGGVFNFRMENKYTKEGFDYTGVYDRIIFLKCIESTSDNRKNKVEFQTSGDDTLIRETYEPDAITPIEVQQNFTDSVLKNFKKFIEQV